MLSSLSTDTIMLISMLCKKMPNLTRYINEYSIPKSAKSPTIKPAQKVTPKQILEARRHPNGIILQALGALLVIQQALNHANVKIEKLTKQRAMLEKTMVALLAAKRGSK